MALRISAHLVGALVAIAFPAAADEVRMFDRAPSQEELRDALMPETRRTRGIEIMRRQDAQPPPLPTRPAAMPAPPQPAEQLAPAAPKEQVAAAPPAAPASIGFAINFPFNSAEIPVNQRGMLDAVGALLRDEPSLRLVVEGHTDARGGDAYNMMLSQRRAEAVRDYLARTGGVDPTRLAAVGKGKGEPIVDNPFDGRNRRVQFRRQQQ